MAKFYPPAIEKAIHDNSFVYALGLRDGSIVEFEGAEPLGEGWVRLKGVVAKAGPLSEQRFDRGLEVAVEGIIWAADAARGS
jgi:hypothetical protein